MSAVSQEDFIFLTGQAHGFVSATLGRNFPTVEILPAKREDVSEALRQMIQEVQEIAGTGSGPEWIQGLLRVGEKAASGRLRRFFSSRILGLYWQSYLNDQPGKLLLVEDNIAKAADDLGFSRRDFFLWVSAHETMHIAQFSGNTALRGYMQRAVEEVAGKQNKKEIEKIKAAMTWIEGSADAMMDVPGLLPENHIKEMRDAVEKRRERVTWANILLRLLGNKGAQYKNGRRFTDEVVRSLGWPAVNMAIDDPAWLPTAEELRAPSLWIQRFEKRDL